MSKEKTIKLVQYILMIVVGILFAVSIVDQSIIIYCIGSAILVYGLFLSIKSVYITRSFIKPDGIIGSALIAIGVSTLCNYVPLVHFGVSAISVTIAAAGAIFLLDSTVKFIGHKNNIAIFELVVGLILLALGLMLCLWGDFREFLWVIFGVLLAVYGIYAICILLTSKSTRKK